MGNAVAHFAFTYYSTAYLLYTIYLAFEASTLPLTTFIHFYDINRIRNLISFISNL